MTAPAPHPDWPPYPVNGRLRRDQLTARREAIVREWLLICGVDPARVPADARVEPTRDGTDEWRIEIVNRAGDRVMIRRRPRRPYAMGGLITEPDRSANFPTGLAHRHVGGGYLTYDVPTDGFAGADGWNPERGYWDAQQRVAAMRGRGA